MRESRSASARQRQEVAIAWRDWGLRRLRRLTTAVVAAAALGLAGLSAFVASAKPGAKSHPVAAARARPGTQVTLPGTEPPRRHHRHRRSHSAAAPAAPAPAAPAPQAAPAAPAPQPAPVAPQPTPAPPVSSSGGS